MERFQYGRILLVMLQFLIILDAKKYIFQTAAMRILFSFFYRHSRNLYDIHSNYDNDSLALNKI